MEEGQSKKRITIKRVSAFKFEIEVTGGMAQQLDAAASSSESDQDTRLTSDGGQCSPRPTLSSDGGECSPRPRLTSDGGECSPRLGLTSESGVCSPRPVLASDGGECSPRPRLASDGGECSPRTGLTSESGVCSPRPVLASDGGECSPQPPERISVIQKAPPSVCKLSPGVHHLRTVDPLEKELRRPGMRRKTPYDKPDEEEEHIACRLPSYDELQTRERAAVPAGAVLISDAISYRIMEILLWKLFGESQLQVCGYPTAPTYRVLWGVVYRSLFEPGLPKSTTVRYAQDHDCGGNMACFLDHACRFLERCAPTRKLWRKFGWTHLSVESILKKIYYEELEPYLREVDQRKSLNIFQSNADIKVLEIWQKQGFTALSWDSQRHLTQLATTVSDSKHVQNKEGPPDQTGQLHPMRDNSFWEFHRKGSDVYALNGNKYQQKLPDR